MRMLEELRAKQDLIATIGIRERAAARACGVSSYYIDPDVGDGIVEEKPDGTLVLHPYSSKDAQNVDAAE